MKIKLYDEDLLCHKLLLLKLAQRAINKGTVNIEDVLVFPGGE